LRSAVPRIAAGTVAALDQIITVSEDTTGSVQQLAGLIQVAGDVQPGDSDGPLVNTAVQVVGVDTAGSVGFRLEPGGGESLALPINDAIAISKQINAGTTSTTIHIGPTSIFGIVVQGRVPRQARANGAGPQAPTALSPLPRSSRASRVGRRVNNPGSP
jgi:S1-C subfamily serine protease